VSYEGDRHFFKFPCDSADRRDPLADSQTLEQLRKYHALGNNDCLHETWIHLGGRLGELMGFKRTYSARIPSRDRSPADSDVSYLDGTLTTEYLEEHGRTKCSSSRWTWHPVCPSPPVTWG
jgi:hypothetical protein